MPFLDQEKAVARTATQAAESLVATLTGQIDSQRQAAAAATAEAEAARVSVTAKESQRPALEAAVAAKDRAVADIEQQIEELQGSEPEQLIEVPNKPPRPNPAWRTWKKRMDDLTQDGGRARSAAAAASVPLAQLNAEIAQLTSAIKAATGRAAQATGAATRLEGEREAAGQRLLAARQELAVLTNWSDEIDRDPINRSALEQVAAALTAPAEDLRDAYAAARRVSRVADEALASLNARRTQVAAELADVNSRLPAAEQAVRTADQAAADLEQQIADQLGG